MIGAQIGNFRLVSVLGRGGMGEVYLAEHVGVQTQVAVKLLHAEISQDTEAIQRLFNEARIVGRIKHAGIARIFDVGMFEGRAYLVMELLEGESLEQRITSGGRIPAADVVEIARQIASILDAAHRAGVTHRDLKPENVYLVTDEELGGRERVKLLDFGVAKLSGSLTASLGPRTIGVLGTPTYMAPEQWSDSSKVTWACDAYALGCVAFEMACGRPPFVAASIAEACTMHLHDTPASARTLAPELPPALDALIARLLAKHPDARGASMAGIARELAALAGGPPAATTMALDSGAVAAPSRPVVAVSTSTPAPTPIDRTTLGGSSGELALRDTRSRSRRTIVGVVAAVAAIAVVATIWTARRDRAPAVARPLAAEPVARAAEPATPPPSAAIATPPSAAIAPPPSTDTAAPPRTPPSEAATPPSAAATSSSRSPANPATRKPRVATTGTLRVAAEPRCDILVDGKPAGRTPQPELKLPAGTHRVTFVNAAAGVRDEVVVEIAAGQAVELRKDYRDRVAPPAPPPDDRQTINPFQHKDGP